MQLVLPQCLGPPSNHRYNPDYQPSGTFDDNRHRDRRGAILAKVVEVVLLSVVVLVLMLVLVVVLVRVVLVLVVVVVVLLMGLLSGGIGIYTAGANPEMGANRRASRPRRERNVDRSDRTGHVLEQAGSIQPSRWSTCRTLVGH